MPTLSIHTSIGRLCAREEDGAIVRLDWGSCPAENATPLLVETRRQLLDYFAGRRCEFDLPLSAAGTAFQQKVFGAMLAIPYGETRSYGELAKMLQTAARAVGGACGANPIAILIPCHRVVGAAGQLTGYSGGGGVDTKARLLEFEREQAMQRAA